MEYKVLLDKINEFDHITLYRHTHPDGDAVGSQLGLKQWIIDNFPQKDVRALGEETFDIYPYVDEADDDFIKSSLAIILDTANKERVDDQRFENAQSILRIDHHPHREDFQDIILVEDKRSSVCEFLTDILTSEAYEGTVFSRETATYLYSGLLTDTINFRTTNCSATTLRAAAKLADTGIDISQLSVRMFDVSEEKFLQRCKMRQHYEFNDGLCMVRLEEGDLNAMGITSNQAKEMVSEFGAVKEFKIWCILAYNSQTGLYDGSLRSKKGYTVNEIATHFNGGGHINAAGISRLTCDDIHKLTSELLNEIKSVENAL